MSKSNPELLVSCFLVLMMLLASGSLMSCGQAPSAEQVKGFENNLALVDESQDGNQKAVKTLLAKGADVSFRDKNGWTPLMVASAYNRKEIVELLLAKGAKVNQRKEAQKIRPCSGKYCVREHTDFPGWTALMFASREGYSHIVSLLLAQDADVNMQAQDDDDTALRIAVGSGRTNVVKILLSHGANINASGSLGSALNDAARTNHADIATLLLEHGAKVDAKDMAGETSLFEASEKGYTDIVMLLLAHGADVNKENGIKQTPLYVAASNNHEDITDLLVAHGAKGDAGPTPLMEAALSGNTLTAKTLLAKGVDVNGRDYRGVTVLMSAAGAGHLEIVKLLLAHGVEINVKLDDGTRDNYYTALMFAAEEGHVEVVKALLANGADTRTAFYGKTALELAMDKGQYEVVKQLFSVANAKAISAALMEAAYEGHTEMMELLLAQDADTKVRNPERKKLLQEALVSASAHGHVKTVKALTDNGASGSIDAFKAAFENEYYGICWQLLTGLS